MLVVYLFHYVNDDLNVMTAMTVANDAGIKMINYKEQEGLHHSKHTENIRPYIRTIKVIST